MGSMSAYTVVWDGTRRAPGGVYLAVDDHPTHPAPTGAPTEARPSLPLVVLRAMVAVAWPQTPSELTARLEGAHSRSAVAAALIPLRDRHLVRVIGTGKTEHTWGRRHEPRYAVTEAGQTLAARSAVRVRVGGA